MTPERWQHIKQVYYEALERPPADRAAFIDSSCREDEAARLEVSQLISSFEETDEFLETPAFEMTARSLVGRESRALTAGQIISHYTVIKPIAAGGMGEVYLANDVKLNRAVALKLLPVDLASTRDRLYRFEQEACAASALNHPNILTIYEIGNDGERHFIAAEYIEGETLRERIARSSLDPHDVLGITIQIANALAAAHKARIVHRDVKPENIMIRREDGLVKVLDFGLAKSGEKRLSDSGDRPHTTRTLVNTAPGMVMGTVAYMSPEQARGLEVDQRADIWSLGCVLYEMVTGKVPFVGATSNEIISAILSRERPTCLANFAHEVPESLEEIVTKALSKDKEQRYQTASDLALDLKTLKEKMEVEAKLKPGRQPNDNGTGAGSANTGISVTASLGEGTVSTGAVSPGRPTTSGRRLVGEVRRHKTLAVGALFALIIGVTGLIYFTNRNKTDLGGRHKKSIAVLPLKPVNASHRDELYEVGVADSLIHWLSSMKGFVVRPLSATRKYADIDQDPLAAGREQQVNYVLASNYQLAGGKIRITAQLFNVGNGQIEETYKSEKDTSDVFAMQDAVARDVGRLLQARFAVTSGSPEAKRGTNNEEAYRLYLQGMNLVDIQHTLSNAQKGVEVLERAVELDPDYAQAWAGKAYAHRAVANFIGRKGSNQEDYQKSMEAINKALSLDENLAEAYSTLCENKMYYEYDFAEAESACKRGIELNPNSPLAHQVYSRYLTSRGRFDEAITEIKTTIDLEPASLFYNGLYGIHLYYARRYPEAIAQFKRVLTMDENFGFARYWLTVTFAAQGNESEAFELFMKDLVLDKADEATVQAFQTAHQSSGWRGVMQELAKRFEQNEERYFFGAYYNAQAGNKDKAFEYLEKSYQRREMWMAYLQVDPRLDPPRDDPRFDELVRRVELR